MSRSESHAAPAAALTKGMNAGSTCDRAGVVDSPDKISAFIAKVSFGPPSFNLNALATNSPSSNPGFKCDCLWDWLIVNNKI